MNTYKSRYSGVEIDNAIAKIDSVETVEANPTETGTTDLSSIKIGGVVYNIPEGGGDVEEIERLTRSVNILTNRVNSLETRLNEIDISLNYDKYKINTINTFIENANRRFTFDFIYGVDLTRATSIMWEFVEYPGFLFFDNTDVYEEGFEWTGPYDTIYVKKSDTLPTEIQTWLETECTKQ